MMPRTALLLASALAVWLCALPACGDAARDTDTGASTADTSADTATTDAETAAPTAASLADAPARGANLLLVTVDTLRADRVGCYGWPAARTPVLDALAARGARAERALAATPVTLPSHTTLLTGLHPFHHGVRDNGVFHVDDALTTLAELLHAQRYRTGAFVSTHVLSERYGLQQGFARYDARFGDAPGGSLLDRRGDHTVDALLEWWDRVPAHTKRPWFTWLHLYDPHAPYAPPPEYLRGASTSERYDAEVAFADAQLGRVLDALRERGELEHTLILVTADHGEALGDHHELTHGMFVYDATQRVPLIVAGPGVRAGRVLHTQLAGVDVLPTLLELLGVAPPPLLDGRSFAAALGSPEPAPSRADALAYLECHTGFHAMGAAPLAALSSSTHKYVEAPRPELYDLRADPGELQNLFDPSHAEARALASALDALRRDAREPPAGAADAATSEELERLAALGYVFAGGGADAQLVDPKDIAERSNALRGQVAYLLSRRAYVEVQPVLEELLELLPADTMAQAALGKALRFTGELERAEALLREVLRVRSDRPDAAIDLAHVLRMSDRREEALEAYETALRAAPRHTTALLEAAQIAYELGRLEASIGYAERALDSGALAPQQRAQTEATLAALRAAAR